MTERIKELLPFIQNYPIFEKNDFRLVGGTAMSYHLDHRISEVQKTHQTGHQSRFYPATCDA